MNEEHRSERDREWIAALEREHRRIGDKLHDELCQTLSGANLMFGTLARAIGTGKPVTPEVLSALQNALNASIDQARALSRRFNPVQLAGTGLMTSLEQLSKETVGCELQCERPVLVANETGLALFRIAQDAVENAVTHAGAQTIRILLTNHDGNTILEVRDDGCGFLASAAESSVGFRTMHARARSVGGSLQIHSEPGKGTAIICTIPPS